MVFHPSRRIRQDVEAAQARLPTMLLSIHALDRALKNYALFQIVGKVFRNMSYNQNARAFVREWRDEQEFTFTDVDFDCYVETIIGNVNNKFEESTDEEFITYLKNSTNYRSLL